jgi:PAS domain S-box-containing protein
MAPNGGSPDRVAAPELPARGVDKPPQQYEAFDGEVSAHARGPLPSFAAMRHSLSVRLLSRVLLFSVCMTLILTLLQLYVEYRRDVSAIKSQLDQIGKINLDSLAERLWTLDENQLRLQLTEILRLPDMRAVEVREAGIARDPLVIRLGQRSASSAITREYPLLHNVTGQSSRIGTLYVEATLEDVYQRLFHTAFTTLVRQGAEIFLVSLFIIYIFHNLVTRHLFAIATFVDSYRINHPPLPLRLRRPPRQQEDELQQVVTAFNALSENLQAAYRNLHDVNDQLTQDVAARRQVEAVLLEREARIRRLVDANIIGIFIWELEGRILEANDAFLRMVGYDREDVVSGRLRWTDLTPPEWRDSDFGQLPELKRTGSVQPYEKAYCRKDGSRIPVLLGAASFEEGMNHGVAFVLDLTERKRSEEALRRSEAYLVEAQMLSKTGSWAYDPATESPIYWSEEMFRMLQFDPKLGLPSTEEFFSRVHPADRQSAIEVFMKATSERREYEDHHRLLLPDGSVTYLHGIGHPVFDSSGNLVEYVGTEVDETERKLAEAERERLKQLEGDLAHMNRVSMMGELAASVAHEIKQPITAAATSAKSSLRWLQREPPDIGGARAAISRIVKDVLRAADMIDRTRSLYTRGAPKPEVVNLNEFIREMVVLLHDKAIQHSIPIRTELDAALPTITADPVQMQQVLMNLMMNGIEAMQDTGGELIIRSKKAEDGQILLAVSDSGIGLPVENAERIFDPFFTTKAQGTGMGLSICRRIIESHNGRLWACANTGRGATFQFTLPRQSDLLDPSE